MYRGPGGLLWMGAAGGRAGGDWAPVVSPGTRGFLGFPACRWRVWGWGAPSAPHLRARVRLLRPSAVRVPSAPAVEDPPPGTLLFLFETKPNKKTS